MANCLECDSPFEITRTSGRPRKFCSTKCCSKHHDRHPDDTKGAPRNRLCARCGKDFVQAKRNQRFCSNECYLGAWTRENKERHAARQKKRREEKPEWYKTRHAKYYQSSRLGIERERPWHYTLKSAKFRAKKYGLDFDLTAEWANARWTGKCEVADLPFQKNDGPGPNPFSCTVDRIVSDKGYTQNNCRFVCMGVNGLKGSGTDADVKLIATAIVKNMTT